VRRYENGEDEGIIRTPTACVLHRADLQRVLYGAAVRAGASIIFDKNVMALDADERGLTFEDGSTATGDLIVGADGVSSHFFLIAFTVTFFAKSDLNTHL
jgi:2-polyprenyl-6-methoxyphenol hydroxylase-like FAD-dependent oxidoreductase